MATFALRKHCAEGYARLGSITTRHGVIRTLRLLPVYNFIGGSTTNCGGIWKYARQRIFQAKIPLMSETMHFTNYRVSPAGLERWRRKTLRRWYSEFKAPLFLDSGGFQLLNNKELDLERFGLEVSAEKILELQLDFGGDLIATLDHPVRPGLGDAAAKERHRFSIRNSIEALRLLEARGDERTGVFVPVHGRDPAEVESYIAAFVSRYRRSGLRRRCDGFAVGSLVPLRTNPGRLIEVLVAVKRELARSGLGHLPVHVFGVGSTLIPYLIYLGFDTFDSSTYVQKARNLQYSHPETWANLRPTQLRELRCDCAACATLDLAEMRNVLTSDVSFRLIDGRFKSEFYADIAMHNLSLHLGAVDAAVEAARSGCLEEHLIEFTRKRIRTSDPLEHLASKFPSLRARLARSTHHVPARAGAETRRAPSRYKPSDFSIPESYRIPAHKSVLLLFTCSKEKPYSTSLTYRSLSAAVRSGLNGLSEKIHFVVVSGLYGPVPLDYENLPQTKNYDYVLTFRNRSGIEEVGRRLADYLLNYGDRFDHVIAIAVSKPYRKAIQRGFAGLRNASMFPRAEGKVKGRPTPSPPALEQCIEFLKALSSEPPPPN